jgi:hypothetical protein
VVGPSPRSGEAEAPPRSRLSPSPGVGRGGVRRLPEPRLSPSPGRARRSSSSSGAEAESEPWGRARPSSSSSGAEAESEPWVGRSGVRRPASRLSPSPGSGEVELPMAPEAGLSCCQPHSVEWHSSRSNASGAVFLSGRLVERRSDCGHFGSVD